MDPRTPSPNEAPRSEIRDLQAEAIRGSRSFESSVEECLKRVESGSRLNAFLTVSGERARERARWADGELAAAGGRIPQHLPLLGVPVAIKDNLQWAGERMTCASKMLKDYVSPFTATAVSRLEAAGAVIIGKTNLDEFAMGGSGEHSAFGPTLNPADPSRVPGGSSSGSAAAVGAGMVPIALGSDTGGSIRLPASFCGIVGIKPSYGRVSRHGLVAFASSLDQVGPMARTLADAVGVLGVIQGADPLDSTCDAAAAPFSPVSGGRRLRIGIPSEFFPSDRGALDPQVRQRVEEGLERLKASGAELVPISLPNVGHSVACYYVLAVAEASSNLSRFDGVRFGSRSDLAAESATIGQFYSRNRSLFGKEVKRRILLGTYALSAGYHDAYYRKACQVRALISGDFERAFGEVDVIASPVAPSTAFRLGQHERDPLQMYLNDLYTIPANLAGLPALSIPVGKDGSGLPVGMQLMARKFDEATLLRAAAVVDGLEGSAP